MFFLTMLTVVLAYFCFKAIMVYPEKLNKAIFNHIWSEDRPAVARETLERIKELMVDGEVSEETAVLMAAKENKDTEEHIYKALDVSDAKELVGLLSGKKPNILAHFAKVIGRAPKKGMRR